MQSKPLHVFVLLLDSLFTWRGSQLDSEERGHSSRDIYPRAIFLLGARWQRSLLWFLAHLSGFAGMGWTSASHINARPVGTEMLVHNLPESLWGGRFLRAHWMCRRKASEDKTRSHAQPSPETDKSAEMLKPKITLHICIQKCHKGSGFFFFTAHMKYYPVNMTHKPFSL